MSESFQIPFSRKTFFQLSEKEQRLVEEAEKAMENAHAPYSRFTVGSALILESGKIVTGNNQENAAYPSGLCAERVALFKAMSDSKEPIDTIVVLAKNGSGATADAFSCGNCRQVMMEYAGMQEKPIKILMRDREEQFIVVDDVRLLLPFNFDYRMLN